MPESLAFGLANIFSSKQDIRKAVLDKGGIFPNGSTFSYYPVAIYNLPSGGDILTEVHHDSGFDGDGTASNQLELNNIRLYKTSSFSTSGSNIILEKSFGSTTALMNHNNVLISNGDRLVDEDSTIAYITAVSQVSQAFIVTTFLPTTYEYRIILGDINSNTGFINYFGDKNTLTNIDDRSKDMSTIISENYSYMKQAHDLVSDING